MICSSIQNSVLCGTLSKAHMISRYIVSRGWSGGAMVLGKLPVPGRPTIWIRVEQGPIALAVGAGGSCLVGCFGLNGPLRQYFSLCRAVSQREGDRGEKG